MKLKILVHWNLQFYRDPRINNVNPAYLQAGQAPKKKVEKKLDYYLKPFSYFPLPQKYLDLY